MIRRLLQSRLQRAATAVALAVWLPSAVADPVKIGDWYYNSDTAPTTTWIVNDSGSEFGFFCNDGDCRFFAAFNTTCEDETEYPALVNATASAYGTTLVCSEVEEESGSKHYFVFKDTEAIEKSVGDGGVIGVATALLSGEFNVSRFSVSNARKAVARVRTGAAKAKNSKGTGDRRL